MLLFVSALSPASQALPRTTAALAGEAGWLSTLIALPVMVLLCLALRRLSACASEGGGLAAGFERALGRRWGRALTFLYLLWGLLVLSANLRAYGQRYLITSYRNTSLAAEVVILLLLVVSLARGKLSAFARAGEIFFLILALMLSTVLFFALLNLEWKNVLPVWVEDLPAGALSALSALGALGHVVFGGFLAGAVRPQPGDGARGVRWTVRLCLLLTAFQFICIGNFGPALVSAMESPLYMMVKGIGVEGGLERIEALVVALWVLCELVLSGVLVFSCCVIAKRLFSLSQTRTAAVPVAALGGAGAIFLFPDVFALRRFTETVLNLGNLVLGFAAPLLLTLTVVLRERRRKRQI